MLKIDLSPISQFRYNQISNYNFCFLLLDENLRAVHSPFMCKDYLQDIFWCENTGKPAGIYGIDWKQGMFNISPQRYRMALLGGKECLKDRKEALTEFLHIFEEAQGIAKSEIFETDSDNNIVLEFDKEWTQNGPLLSTFTSLIRLSGAYSVGEDVSEYLKKLAEFANKKHDFPKYMTPDINRMDNSLVRLLAILSGKKIEHSWDKFDNVAKAHNKGLVGFEGFPTISLKGETK